MCLLVRECPSVCLSVCLLVCLSVFGSGTLLKMVNAFFTHELGRYPNRKYLIKLLFLMVFLIILLIEQPHHIRFFPLYYLNII